MKKAEYQMQNIWTALIYGAWHPKDDFLSFYLCAYFSCFIEVELVYYVSFECTASDLSNTLKNDQNKSSNQLLPYKIVVAALLTILLMLYIMC